MRDNNVRKLPVVSKKNFVVDATHATYSNRNEYYKLASDAKYQTVVIYMRRDGRGWNNLRITKKVPDVAYHRFFKSFESPLFDNEPYRVYVIN